MDDIVPAPGVADRKRVLNVLAQRRYRQRRKEELKTLRARSGRKGDRLDANHSSFNWDDTPADEALSALLADPTIELNREATATQPLDDFFLSSSDGSAMAPTAPADLTWTPPEFVTPQTTTPFVPLPTPADVPVPPNNNVFTFPDEHTLDLPVVATLRAGLTIARLLGHEHTIWNPTTLTLSTPSQSCLPPNLIPTSAQLSVPHHPLLDILPWPSVRSKIICAFTLPPALRSPEAQDPVMAIVQMVHDIDDLSEGFRVHGSGGNEADAESWEVGPAFFRRWWWALDQEVIRVSNSWRARRGEARLSITAV